MKTIAVTFILGLALYAAKDPNTPQYDSKTETEFTGSIVKVYESTGTLAGVYAKIDTRADSFEVYFAPASFVRMLDIPLKAGMKDVGITGSKVTLEGRDIILVREVRIEKTLYSLRDRSGFPSWVWPMRLMPTGL